MNCLVCDSPSIDAIYAGGVGVSITSLGAAIQAPTHVDYCKRCGHLQTRPIIDTNAYYDQGYNLNTASEDEDQLYALVDNKPVFRSAHQSATALTQVDLPNGARVLDYGCGSGHIARAMKNQRSDLVLHLFDISENYKTAWSRWIDEAKTACYRLPETWVGTFDLIVSFFALEHADEPRAFADELFCMLRPGGRVYLVIPNTYQNVADMIVVDHLNHFSQTSLRWLLEQAGFTIDSISDRDNDSAWTVLASRPESPTSSFTPPPPESLRAIETQASKMANFWQDCDARIAAFEKANPALPAVIYGSGVYGSYLYSRLADPNRVESFLDRNPHQQKKTLYGRPILDPQSLDDQARVVWVGLNPRIARNAIADLSTWRDRPYSYFYL